MIKRIFYSIMRMGMEYAFHIYVKHYSVISSYKEKRRDSIVYAANHGNAFFDAFSIIYSQNKFIVFLTRAGVFGSKLASFMLGLFYMMPIYRQRDGIKSVAKNQVIMAKCIEMLKEGRHPIAMFPEGNHNMRFGVRPLQKGISRIVFECLEKYPDLDLKIIPVGINYSDHTKFRANVLVLKGPPIYVKDYMALYATNKVDASKKLLSDLSKEIQKLTLKIPSDGYEEIDSLYRKYRSHSSDLESNFYSDKVLIQNLIDGNIPKEEPIKKSRKGLHLFRRIITLPIGIIAWVSNFIPILLIRYIVKKIVSDPHFIDSIKYAGSTFLFPIIYLIQSFILYAIFHDWWISIVYFFLIPFISKFYFEYLYKAD